MGKNLKKFEDRKDPKKLPSNKEGKGAGNNKKSNPNKDYGPKFKDHGSFKSCNDVKWYSQNPELMKTASQISYGQILGLANDIEHTYLSGDTAGTPYANKKTVPGIMAIRYIPGIGVSNNKESNINVAARLAYTFMRHANSGSRNYESPDYMTYLLAVGNAQAYFAWMVRLYGLINHQSVQNRYKVAALVEAAGGNYNDLVNKMASFHYYINYYGNKINSFAVPKDQYIFDRMTFLPLHVFTDGEDPKAQMYLFKPEGYYRWTGTKYETGSALEFVYFSGVNDLDDIIEYGNKLLNALLSNEDIGIMSGDTLKAYKPEGIRQVGMIDSTYATPIIKDDGVLAQIHNALSLPNSSTLTNLDITQQGGELKYAIRGLSNGRPCMDKIFFDSWLSDPDAAYNMEASRLITFVKYVEGSTDYNFEVVTSGTEVITSFEIYYYAPTGQLGITQFTSNDIRSTGYQGTTFISASVVELLTKFDWHPIIYATSTDQGSIGLAHVIGDLQNYTIMDVEMVDRMHNCAIQSLFNVFGLYLKTY